jgi:hypothetical protein
MAFGVRSRRCVKNLNLPSVVTRPMVSLARFTNQSAPSGPSAMPSGLSTFRCSNVATWPSVVMRPTRSAENPVNHTAPSGPAVSWRGPPSASKVVMSPTAAAAGAGAGAPSTAASAIAPAMIVLPGRTAAG